MRTPNLPRPNPLEEARVRRDAMKWVIKEQCGERCEDCGQSVRGLAVFECKAKRGSTSLYCCPRCASQELDPVRAAHSSVWARVVLVRSGRSGARVGRWWPSGYVEVWPTGLSLTTEAPECSVPYDDSPEWTL